MGAAINGAINKPIVTIQPEIRIFVLFFISLFSTGQVMPAVGAGKSMPFL
jgi:hypothetical protein